MRFEVHIEVGELTPQYVAMVLRTLAADLAAAGWGPGHGVISGAGGGAHRGVDSVSGGA